MPFAVARDRHRVDGIHRPARGAQRSNQQPARRFDSHRDRIIGGVTDRLEHAEQLGEPIGVIGDPAFDHQLSTGVDHRHVVVILGPADPAESLQIGFYHAI